MGKRNLSFEESLRNSVGVLIGISTSLLVGILLIVSGIDVLANSGGSLLQETVTVSLMGYIFIFLGLVIVHGAFFSSLYGILAIGVGIAFGKQNNIFSVTAKELLEFLRTILVPLIAGISFTLLIILLGYTSGNFWDNSLLILLSSSISYLLFSIPIYVKIVSDGISLGLQKSGFYSKLSTLRKRVFKQPHQIATSYEEE